MSVTAAKGFRAAGVAAGLKASGARDLALVVNDGPEKAAAAVFTTNRCQAAPVVYSREASADGRVDAVVLNSGGANCYTGKQGYDTTVATAEQVARVLGVSAADVVVCSTGLIGDQLPRETVLAGIEAAASALSDDGGATAAEAIMTTDTHPKTEVYRDPAGWTVGGMAKGAGMLAPGLATMLVVITTDAKLPTGVLDRALRHATRVTLDRLDSDGCMSTNDTVTLLASGASGVTPDEEAFTAALTGLCHRLGQQLLSDAEGADHDIAITTKHAATEDDAVEVSRSVARNNLFKAAVFGCDPNWGRVLAAVGTTRAVFDPTVLDVAINGVWVARDGEPGEDRSLVTFDGRAVEVVIDLKAGDAEATVWTNDLTHGYVEENSAYAS